MPFSKPANDAYWYQKNLHSTESRKRETVRLITLDQFRNNFETSFWDSDLQRRGECTRIGHEVYTSRIRGRGLRPLMADLCGVLLDSLFALGVCESATSVGFWTRVLLQIRSSCPKVYLQMRIMISKRDQFQIQNPKLKTKTKKLNPKEIPDYVRLFSYSSRLRQFQRSSSSGPESPHTKKTDEQHCIALLRYWIYLGVSDTPGNNLVRSIRTRSSCWKHQQPSRLRDQFTTERPLAPSQPLPI